MKTIISVIILILSVNLTAQSVSYELKGDTLEVNSNFYIYESVLDTTDEITGNYQSYNYNLKQNHNNSKKITIDLSSIEVERFLIVTLVYLNRSYTFTVNINPDLNNI